MNAWQEGDGVTANSIDYNVLAGEYARNRSAHPVLLAHLIGPVQQWPAPRVLEIGFRQRVAVRGQRAEAEMACIKRRGIVEDLLVLPGDRPGSDPRPGARSVLRPAARRAPAVAPPDRPARGALW